MVPSLPKIAYTHKSLLGPQKNQSGFLFSLAIILPIPHSESIFILVFGPYLYLNKEI